MIKRSQTQYDIAHGGTFNSEFLDNGIPIVKGTDKNHSQKMETDENLTFTKETGENGEDELNITGTANITNNANIGMTANVGCELHVTSDSYLCGTLDVCCATCIDNTLNVSNATCFCDTVTIDGCTTINDGLDVACDTCIAGNTYITGNTEIQGTLTVNDETTINAATNINGTTTIAGDLYVKGTAYEEHSTDIYVGADFVTLRDGAETGLDDGEKAGIIINNYDGTDSLGIITDTEGTLRIGEFNIAKVFTKNDTDYYSDRDLTISTTIPDGSKLFQIGETDPETDLKEYYYIEKDDTEPVATRASDSDLTDHSLTCWDAAGKDFHTIEMFTEHGQLLQSVLEKGTKSTTAAIEVLLADESLFQKLGDNWYPVKAGTELNYNGAGITVEVIDYWNDGTDNWYRVNNSTLIAEGASATVSYKVDEENYKWVSNQANGSVLTADPDKNLQWSENATNNGQLLGYNGEDLCWTPRPTENNTFLVWDTETESWKEFPLGNDGEVLTTSNSSPELYIKDCNGWYDGSYNVVSAECSEKLEDLANSGGLKSVYIRTDETFYLYPDYIYGIWKGKFDDFQGWDKYPLPIRTAAFGDNKQVYISDCAAGEFLPIDPPDGYTCIVSSLRVYETAAAQKNLQWSCLPSNYIFATMADYESVAACVPNGSRVAIANCCDYTISEDK